MRNANLKFICHRQFLKVERNDTAFTKAYAQGQAIDVCVAHGEGNYFAEPDLIARLEANRQVIFRYTSAAGEVRDDSNPNGSAAAIAGLCNEARNVVGL